jgi:hypothetical protein
MVDSVRTQILQDGPRNAVIKFTDFSDGTGETAVLKVDVSTLSGFNGRIPTEVRIEKIEYSLDGMQVEILWDATVDVIAWILTPSSDNDIDFRSAPLVNDAGAGKTGDILFTTIGASAGDSYSIILHLVKHYSR